MPGIIFDASNSWNGYVHQGKVALFEAIKYICELWDAAKTLQQNKYELNRYFLELEYYEDFSIGIKQGENNYKYIDVHQVKDKESANLSSYDSALLGLVQHVVDNSDIVHAYLHVTTDLNTSKDELTTHILEINKEPKFILDEIKLIEDNRDNEEFREGLIKPTKGRRSTLKQNLYSALKEMGREIEGVTQDNLNDVFDYHLALLNNKMTEFAAADRDTVAKIEFYTYPTENTYCQVDEIRNFLINIIKGFYNKVSEYNGSYKQNDSTFHEKCYFYLCEKINEHIVERDLNYHDYMSGLKSRKIKLSEIVGWLQSDEIDSYGEIYYLYHTRESIFNYLREFCNDCEDNSSCIDGCAINEFQDKLAKMEYDELRKFTYFSNPQVSKEITISNLPDFAAPDGYIDQFSEGLKSIEKSMLEDKPTVTYRDNQNKDCVLTTLRKARDRKISTTCSKILNNENIYQMMMESDFLISKDINVDSIQDEAVTPLDTENAVTTNITTEDINKKKPANGTHITRCKNVGIISLDKFKEKLNGDEE